MNFKKGSAITKERLSMENKKSLKILKNLPTNLMSQAYLDIDIMEMEILASQGDWAKLSAHSIYTLYCKNRTKSINSI